MVYNIELLEDLLSYIQSTYNTLESVATDILSNELNSTTKTTEKVKPIFEDFLNIVKIMEFCKEKDDFFVHDINNSINVLKETMEVFEGNDMVLLYDFLYYSLANELINMFQAIEAKLNLS